MACTNADIAEIERLLAGEPPDSFNTQILRGLINRLKKAEQYIAVTKFAIDHNKAMWEVYDAWLKTTGEG